MLTPKREKELRKLASLEMQQVFAEIDRLREENRHMEFALRCIMHIDPNLCLGQCRPFAEKTLKQIRGEK